MPIKTSTTDPQLTQGRDLARALYDLKLHKLENLSAQERASYREQYPLLSEVEFLDVQRQVIEAKKAEQIRVGWFSIPHDITVLVFVLITWLIDLPSGVIVGTATLVLLESLVQVYFNPRLYLPLSLLVWFTYPAYLLLGWLLYTRGMPWVWVLAVIAGAWVGTHLAGILARIPMQLLLKARQEASASKKPKR